MKTFIVFVAVIAVACGNTVGRVGTGWGNKPTIDLELVAAAAAAAVGQASAGQSLLETASGNSDVPAQVLSVNGVGAAVLQGEDIEQIELANKPSGATTTINAVDAYNEAIAEDILEAVIEGANSATVQNVANTDASGEGVVIAEEASYNSVQQQTGGWKQ